MSDVEYLSRKISTLPLRSPVLRQDLIVVVGDGTPPDGFLGSVDDIAALAGAYAPQGPAGPTGPAGPVGPAGASLSVDGSVPDVADLDNLNVPPGSCYVVGSDGSLWIFDGTDWIEMQSSTGPQGPQGPPGAQGPVGPKGDTGPQGAQGIAGQNVPTGVVLDYAGQIAPAGFVLCNGDYYDPASPTYAPLFNVIGYLYGQDANGHFRTPPFNGRVAVSREPANPIMGTTGKLGGRSDTPLKQHRHNAGSLLMPNHSHDIAHGHPQGITAEATVPPNYMHLPGYAPGLYVQGQNNAAWPPGNRGVTLLNPWQFPASGWDWLFADGNNNIVLQGDGRHAHYFTTPALGYGAARSEYVTGAVTGETQDSGENTAAATGSNYPPFITVNKIIRL